MVKSVANQIAVALSDKVNCPLTEVVDAVTEILSHYSLAEMNETLPSTGDGSTTMYLLSKFKDQKIAQGMKPKTYRQYEDAVIKLCQTVNKEANLMSTDDLTHYLEWYRYNGNNGKGCSDTSVHNKYLLLSSFYSFLTDYKYIAENPIKIIPVPKAKNKVKQPLTDREKEQLYVACENCYFGEARLRITALITFAIDTGARVEELCNLNVDNIDFINKTCLIKDGKGKKDRVVVFGEATSVRLENYLKARADMPLINPVYANPLFASLKGSRERITTDGMRRMLNQLGDYSGISRLHPHLLRTTCATDLIKKGVPLNVVADQLGHESLETTTIYTKIDIDTRKKMIQSVI